MLGTTIIALSLAAQPDLLKGPEVETNETPSIVNRAMTGRFILVEGRPEAAAFESLPIDEETKAAGQQIVERRINRLALSLVDEIDLVREMTDDTRAGRMQEATAKRLALHEQLDPNTPRDPLLKPLEAILESPEHRQMLRNAVNEYWQDWISATIRSANQDPADQALRERAQEQLANQLFQQDLTAAYEISLNRYQRALEAIYNAIEPTPEQREKVRSLVIDHIKSTRLEATNQERREVMLQIYRSLDDDRKEKLFDYMTAAALN